VSNYPKSPDRATSAEAEKQALELLKRPRPASELPAWHTEEPSSLDLDDRAQNRREAGLLVRAALSPPPPQSAEMEVGRAGYAVVGRRSSDEARVHPRLAEVLAAGVRDRLQDRFPELWAVDWLTWERLENSEVRAVSTAWLSSPGRRLLSDLDVLRALRDDAPSSWDPGPTDLSSERLRAAIGLGASTQLPDGWSELHTAIPGTGVHAWVPRLDEHPVPRIIDLMERGLPPMLRGMALAWLLNRAVDSPVYSFEGLTRDLRQDLPVHLATAFAAKGELAVRHHTARRLEATLLQHVACMSATRLHAWTSAELWHLTRWLHGALIRSPWLGGDIPALVERLRAHLPQSAPAFDPSSHPLHPARFGDRDDDAVSEGLDAEEFAIVAGALDHYGGGGRTWTPAPRPLVQELRRIARRPLKDGERWVEKAMNGEHCDQMGWSPLTRHLAPPLSARWLLSHLRTGWMADAVSSACGTSVQETLELLKEAPEQYDWVCFAWMEEGPSLPEHTQCMALKTWVTLSERTAPEMMHLCAALGAGLLDVMSPADIDNVITQAQVSAPSWRVNLLNILAERLGPETEHWNAVIDALMAQAIKPTGSDKERVDSAVLTVRRLGAAPHDVQHERLQKIADLIVRPPFSRHSGLRRELRRLGFSPQRAAGVD